MNNNESISFIPTEMREASQGSFPLSPGVMGGHYAVSDLYWHNRSDILRFLTIEEVFGTANPEPPTITIPKNHTRLSSPQGLNSSVWNTFLRTSFEDRPNIDSQKRVRDLISINAHADASHFAARMRGEKSKVIHGKPAPSILRAFVFENRHPYQNNEFFQWLVAEMAREIVSENQNNFDSAWSSGLKGLVLMWNAHFPEEAFIPSK